MDIGINKQGQAHFENFKENEEKQASIKKENDDNKSELNAYQLYEY